VESQTVIDVEVEEVDSNTKESIDRWYTAGEVQVNLNLNKSALQQAIEKLVNIYAIDIRALRQGQARATRYSQLAVDAIGLHKANKFAELRKLLDRVPSAAPKVTSGAIVFLERHNQIATTATAAADNNLSQISSLKEQLLNNYRTLGRAAGRQAGAEFELGFTEGVAASIKKVAEA